MHLQLPGDVLAPPASGLCGWKDVILSLSVYLSDVFWISMVFPLSIYACYSHRSQANGANFNGICSACKTTAAKNLELKWFVLVEVHGIGAARSLLLVGA